MGRRQVSTRKSSLQPLTECISQEAQTHLLFFRYITRADASPLMDSLCLWRDTALKSRYSHRLSRSVSSGFDDERTRIQEEDSGNWPSDDRGLGPRSTVELYTPVRKTVTEPSDGSVSASRKPTSSSWSRWWSRSKDGEIARPDLKPLNSAPPEVVRFQLLHHTHSDYADALSRKAKAYAH